ncbi:MAG: glycosyltransferase family 9 protein [Proteobacteria bacterium]|nr:glycosyltransferase family 9 protein [Pseudomonadota bacterium]
MIYLEDTGRTAPRPLSVRRVLIIQLGDIGDVVWSLPAFRAVREAWPGAAVSVLLRAGNGSLLTSESHPPKIFEVRKGVWESLRLIWALRREKFDLVFDLRGDERGGYTAFLTGAPVRAARHYPALAWPRNLLFTHLIVSPVGSMPTGAAESSLSILRAFGIETKSVIPNLQLSAEARARVSQILADEGITAAVETSGTTARGDLKAFPAGTLALSRLEPTPASLAAGHSERGGAWVTVNPFSRWSYKEWGVEKWVQVTDWLRRDFGIATVLVGAPAERERAEELARACSGRVHNLTGRTTLAELAGILELSRLHIGVDSAAPHIAAAVGTQTVTLYGPSDWRHWKPPGESHRVVVSGMDCVPCHQKGCDGSGVSRCLDTLEVGQVQAVVCEALFG